MEVATLDGPNGEGLSDPVRVRVKMCGICGSDLHMLEGEMACTPGHEFAGLLDDGTAVAVQPFVPCGACDQCHVGATHRCRVMFQRFHGVTFDGGLAEEVLVERASLVVLGAGVRVEDACLVEPLAVAVRALNGAGCNSGAGERILVVGGGTVGLAVVAVARHRGFDVGLMARHPRQIEAGERLGATTGIGQEYATVFEAAGTQSAMDEALARVAPGGTVAIPGTYWQPVSLGFTWLGKEARLLPSVIYGHDEHGVRDFDAAAALLAANPAIPDAFITHRFGIDDVSEALRVAADRAAGAIKVAIHP